MGLLMPGCQPAFREGTTEGALGASECSKRSRMHLKGPRKLLRLRHLQNRQGFTCRFAIRAANLVPIGHFGSIFRTELTVGEPNGRGNHKNGVAFRLERVFVACKQCC